MLSQNHFFVSQSDPHVFTFLPPIVICTLACWWGGLHTEDHWSCSKFFLKKVVMLLPFLVCTSIYVWMKQGVLMKTCQTSTKQSTQQQRERKRVQVGWTQVHIKRRNHQLGHITRGTWTNQGLKTSPRNEHVTEEEEGRFYNIYPRITFVYNNNTFQNRDCMHLL